MIERQAVKDPATLANLQRQAALRRMMDDTLASYVELARREGHSWHAIGVALGITGEGARKRFGGAPSTTQRGR
jgi:hypothetical protein